MPISELFCIVNISSMHCRDLLQIGQNGPSGFAGEEDQRSCLFLRVSECSDSGEEQRSCRSHGPSRVAGAIGLLDGPSTIVMLARVPL